MYHSLKEAQYVGTRSPGDGLGLEAAAASEGWAALLGACRKLGPSANAWPRQWLLGSGRDPGEAGNKGGARMVLGQLPGRGAWPDLLASPNQLQKLPDVQSEGPGAWPGLYRSLWKVGLEEASWSGRGSGGGLSVGIVTNTALGKATVLAPAWRGRHQGRPKGLWCGLGRSTVSLRVSACPLACGPCLAGGCRLQNRNCRWPGACRGSSSWPPRASPLAEPGPARCAAHPPCS